MSCQVKHFLEWQVSFTCCWWITRHGLYFLGWHWVHGPVQPSCSCVWCWTTGEDHRCLPWPVSLVWSRQEAPVSSVGETIWHRTSTTVDLQMVPRLVCVWFTLKFDQEVCSFTCCCEPFYSCFNTVKRMMTSKCGKKVFVPSLRSM